MTESSIDPRDACPTTVLCSDCFANEGLRLDARKLGWTGGEPCPQCGSQSGAKLDVDLAIRHLDT